MIKKIALYSLLFLLSLLVFVVASMPASIVWDKLVSPNINLRSMGISVPAVEGSIWDGKALVKYRSLASVVDWRIDPLGVFTLSLPVKIEVDSQAGTLKGELKAGMMQSDFAISKADIDLAQINSFVRKQRVTLSGNLFVKDVAVTISGKQMTMASGIASWSGGKIAYPAQRKTHERDMPPFQVKVETKDTGDIYAGVRDSGGAFDVIEASLSPQGVGFVQVKRRLLDLADEHWPKNSAETDTVFKVKKNIYK